MADTNHSSVPEGFKEIPGYDGRYFINEKGEVWSTFKYRVLTQHLDSSKNYLQIDNLEWTTCEENLRHAWENGLQSFGENSSNSRFTSGKVRSIRLRLLAGEKCKAIAVELGVGVECIKKIQQYISWKRQDWDLIEPMMKICKSKWLRVTLDCVNNGGKFWDYSRPYIADF